MTAFTFTGVQSFGSMAAPAPLVDRVELTHTIGDTTERLCCERGLINSIIVTADQRTVAVTKPQIDQARHAVRGVRAARAQRKDRE